MRRPERVAALAGIGTGVSAAAPFTGRVNLHAEARGVLAFDRERVDRLNLVDEAITLGTLPPFTVVGARQMVATIKIIPFAAPELAVKECVKVAMGEGTLLRVAPFRPLSVGLIQTRLPGLKESILDKTREVTEGRLTALGCKLAFEGRCSHQIEYLGIDDPRRFRVRDRHAVDPWRIGNPRPARRDSIRNRARWWPGRSFRHAG